MAKRTELINLARKLRHQIADLDLFDELNSDDHPISSTPSDEEKKESRKKAHQKRKELAKVMTRINKTSSSGGGRAAGIGSALGRTPKSLLKSKIMPNT